MESIVSAATFNDNITGLRKQTSMRSTILLPEDFILSSSDVLCGRGSQCFNHEGNRKFRKLVESRLQRYSGASTKHDKTQIICEIIDLVRQDSPLGGFVKRDLEAGRYYEVGDFHAREKTSQAFRDALQEKYKSSYVSRKKFRKRLRHSEPCLTSANLSGGFETPESGNQNASFEWLSKLQESFSTGNLGIMSMQGNRNDEIRSMNYNKQELDSKNIAWKDKCSMSRSFPKAEEFNQNSWLDHRFNPIAEGEVDECLTSKVDTQEKMVKHEFVPALRKNSLASQYISFHGSDFVPSLSKFAKLSSNGFLFDGSVAPHLDSTTNQDDVLFERLLQLTEYDSTHGNLHLSIEPMPLP